MSSVNKVILIGNVGADPDIQTFDNGTTKAAFSLATSEKYKDRDGEKQEKTEWHNIVLWKGLVDIVEKYVKKGDKLYIEGKITTRSWDGKDGNKRYITEIVAMNMTMLGSKNSSSDGEDEPEKSKEVKTKGQKVSSKDQKGEPTPNEEDDLPF